MRYDLSRLEYKTKEIPTRHWLINIATFFINALSTPRSALLIFSLTQFIKINKCKLGGSFSLRPVYFYWLLIFLTRYYAPFNRVLSILMTFPFPIFLKTQVRLYCRSHSANFKSISITDVVLKLKYIRKYF